MDINMMKPYLNRYALYLTRNHHDAEDLVSITFLKFYEITIRDGLFIEHPKSYMRKIMYSSFVSEFVRKNKPSTPYEDYKGVEAPAQHMHLNIYELQQIIREADSRSREIINMFISGKGATDISRSLTGFRSSLSTVRSVISQFRYDVAATIGE